MDECKSYEDLECTMEQWDNLYETGKNASYFFLARKIKKIAVYGVGQLKSRLFEDLKGSDVEVSYLIGSGKDIHPEELPVFMIGGKLPAVELIVVAAAEGYMEVERGICEANRIEVIGIQELVEKTLRNVKLYGCK